MRTTHPFVILAALLGVAADKPKRVERAPVRDPAAIQALDRMGAFLRSQQHFTVRTKTTTDFVVGSGQKVQLSARGELDVDKPDHLRAEQVSDRKQREFFYDGKTFTVYSPKMGYYASVAAPPTIVQLIDTLQARYGLELPLVDLFRWGTPSADESAITSAFLVDSTTVDGAVVDQYAFRQPGLDWQVWIQRGPISVPLKIVLTTTDDPALPEHTIAMTWDLDAKHDATAFTFRPPPDARPIAMGVLGPAPKTQPQPARAPQTAQKP